MIFLIMLRRRRPGGTEWNIHPYGKAYTCALDAEMDLASVAAEARAAAWIVSVPVPDFEPEKVPPLLRLIDNG